MHFLSYLAISVGSGCIAFLVGTILYDADLGILLYFGLFITLYPFFTILAKINENLEKQNRILKGTDTDDETETDEGQDQPKNAKNNH